MCEFSIVADKTENRYDVRKQIQKSLETTNSYVFGTPFIFYTSIVKRLDVGLRALVI